MSLFFHGSIFFWPAKATLPIVIPVKGVRNASITLHNPPARTINPPAAAPPAKPPRHQQTSRRHASSDPTPERRSERGPAAFFPTADEFAALAASDGDGQNNERAGDLPAEARVTAQALGGSLNIPLFLRETIGYGKSSAKVRRRGAHLVLAWVHGTPALRAALFEALRLKQSVIARLMLDLSVAELTVTLVCRSQIAAIPTDKYTEKITIGRHHLSIERIRSTGPLAIEYGPKSGLLPDEEAKRAIARDRADVARLERSPAFHAALRDVPL